MSTTAPNRFGVAGLPGGLLVPVAGDSEYLAVTTGDQDIITDSGTTETWVYTANVDTFVKQGTGTVTASAADGSMFVPAGMPVLIDGAQGAVVSVLGLAAGHATLQRVVAMQK